MKSEHQISHTDFKQNMRRLFPPTLEGSQKANMIREKAKQQEKRRTARTEDLSPYRPYREREGDFELFINDQPFTGIQEFPLGGVFDTRNAAKQNELFQKQQEVYNYLRKKLNKASPIKQEQHRFNMEQISNPLDPKLKTVHLRGGPDINTELYGTILEPGEANVYFGRANPAEKTLSMNRLLKNQTNEAIDTHLQSNPEDKRGLKKDIKNPDIIHTKLHEEGHLNTLNEGKYGPKIPSVFDEYDFGNYNSIPGIVHTGLFDYPNERYPAEVIGFTTGNIDVPFPKREHPQLAEYLKKALDYYEQQGMKTNYPDLHKTYLDKINTLEGKESIESDSSEEEPLYIPSMSSTRNKRPQLKTLEEKKTPYAQGGYIEAPSKRNRDREYNMLVNYLQRYLR